jgi:hypothetical protein
MEVFCKRGQLEKGFIYPSLRAFSCIQQFHHPFVQVHHFWDIQTGQYFGNFTGHYQIGEVM